MAAMIRADLQNPTIRAEVAGLPIGEQHRRQQRPAELAAQADKFASRRACDETEPADRPGSEVLQTSECSDSRPLLVLDAGELLARCRRCGWNSPPAATPDEARAAFEAHVSEERPA